MTLRTIARAAALRAARQLPPDARNALDGLRWLFAGHYGGLAQLPERMGYLVSIERRFLALCDERDGLRNRLACAVEMAAQAEHERDALRLELAEHLEALEEVRARLAAEQRGAATATLIAQREAQQAIAAEALLVAHRMERRAREAEERLRAAQLAAEGGR